MMVLWIRKRDGRADCSTGGSSLNFATGKDILRTKGKIVCLERKDMISLRIEGMTGKEHRLNRAQSSRRTACRDILIG